MSKVSEEILGYSALLSSSEVFQSAKFNMNWMQNTLSESDLDISLNLLKLKRKYKLNAMLNYLKAKKIVMCYDPNSKVSTIQCAPGLANNKGAIGLCNLSAEITIDKQVDNQGYMKDKFLVTDTETLYEFLKFGFVTVNAGRILDNSGIRHRLAEVYTDLMAELITRRFGSSGDGDALRFIIKNFFYRGTIAAEDLANLEKFNLGRAKELEFKYPDFFGMTKKDMKLSTMFKVINSEFKAVKPLVLADVIKACAIQYSEQSVFFMDNVIYMLYIVVNSEHKFSQFRSQALRQYGPNLKTLVMDIMDICE